MAKAKTGLTPRQRKFVNAYLLEPNATKAAVKAGYSAKAAHSCGPRLLENAGVRREINKRTMKAAEAALITKADVLNGLKAIASLDLGRAYDADGKLLHVSKMPEDIRKSLAGIEVDALFEGHGGDRVQVGITSKVKLPDRVRAWETLGKHLALWTEKVEHTFNLEQLLDESGAGE